jgi:hypothetical protein
MRKFLLLISGTAAIVIAGFLIGHDLKHAPDREAHANAARELTAEYGPAIRMAIHGSGYECGDVFAVIPGGADHHGRIVSALCSDPSNTRVLRYRAAIGSQSGRIKITPPG